MYVRVTVLYIISHIYVCTRCKFYLYKTVSRERIFETRHRRVSGKNKIIKRSFKIDRSANILIHH